MALLEEISQIEVQPANKSTINKLWKIAGILLAITIVEELEKLDKTAVVEAKAKGITVISWPEEEVAKFRKIAESQWPKWSNSPTAKTWSDAVAAYWKSKE